MKTQLTYLSVIACLTLMLCLFVAPSFAEIQINDTSLTVIVNSMDSSRRLADVEVTIEDNFEMISFKEQRTLVTGENGSVTFGSELLDGFTVYEDGFAHEEYEISNIQKTYHDSAEFKLKITIKTANTIPEEHEINLPVNEDMEYTINYKEI